MARPMMNRIADLARGADNAPHLPADANGSTGISVDTATIAGVNTGSGVYDVEYNTYGDPVVSSIPPVKPYSALSNSQLGDVVQVLRDGDTVLGVLGKKITPTKPASF